MKRSLPDDRMLDAVQRLLEANREHSRRYPGDGGARQPVHTVYGGAQLFKAEAGRKLGQTARQTLETYAPRPSDLAGVLGWEDESLARIVYQRIQEKLEREPVEDFRIDFEDGFGHRSGEEEDHHAVRAGLEVARGMEEGVLPPYLGIRIKPLNSELVARSTRTLDLFLTALVEKSGGRLPDGFVVTLPKVPIPAQAEFLAQALGKLEGSLSLEAGSLKIELMVELPQSILDPEGAGNLPRLVDAAAGRCVALHFGTYDYTASCQITAAFQVMDHPACDFAKHMMQVMFSGRNVWLSDGATNVLPVPPNRGEALPPEQVEENRRVVFNAWRLHYGHIRHSLEGGFYQGWDLHPGQLPTRYAAVYAFFQESLAAASQRLANFVEKAAQATLVGDVFDDAATGQGLLNFFLRGLGCGAISPQEATATGLTLEELRTRSFTQILRQRERGSR